MQVPSTTGAASSPSASTRCASERAPLGGLEASGWRLAYDGRPNAFAAGRETTRGVLDWSYGPGLKLTPEGKLVEVVHESPAFAAGLVPDPTIVGFGGATNPHLERIPEVPDLLAAPLRPRSAP